MKSKKVLHSYIGALILAWLVVLMLSIVESATYPGFVLKHLYVDLLSIIFVVVILGFFIKIFLKIERNVPNYLEKVAICISIILSVVVFLCNFIEGISYTNYIFSRFHVHPKLLYTPLFLSYFGLFLFIKKDTIWNKSNNAGLAKYFKTIYKVRTLLLIICFWLIFQNLTVIWQVLRNDILFMVKHRESTVAEKMRYKVGDKFYKFVDFVQKNTPPYSTILIPPQGYPWPQTGNPSYIRYFLYPRKVVVGKEYEANIDLLKSNIDYVLIAHGETDTTEFGFTHGWPKFDVPSDYVLYMEDDKELIRQYEHMYLYKNSIGKEQWGIIKIKK